ncbi:hypothetical protein [Vibrio tubiashii]|uniref:hypothetical protein n=1 Tax=Vibrio tubiashii TaxID=29498 RepID=UPI00349EC68A
MSSNEVNNTDDTQEVAVNPSRPIAAKPDAEIFVDGAASIMMRSGVAKVDFYQAIGPEPEGKGEVRRVSQRIILPVAGLFELSNMLNQAVEAIKQSNSKDLDS